MTANCCPKDQNNGQPVREKNERAGGSSHQVFAVIKFIVHTVYFGVQH